jgi:hypothetical protein
VNWQNTEYRRQETGDRRQNTEVRIQELQELRKDESESGARNRSFAGSLEKRISALLARFTTLSAPKLRTSVF